MAGSLRRNDRPSLLITHHSLITYLPFMSTSTPQWVQDAVFYQIFPDRFRRSKTHPAAGILSPWGAKPTSHNFMGGNLRGIREGLTHIQELGANSLYLCPIFASTSNHRYHTNDYFQIDPLLGTLKDFDDLVKEVHKRGMRIILDGVFNHCSRGLYQFNSLLECGVDSPFRDWFHVDSYPINAYSGTEPNYRCWWNIPALPKFNTANPEVREFLWSVGEFWTRRGIDGWRLDVPNEIDDDSFWQEFRSRVKKVNPEAYIVGEIWGDPSRWLQGDQFDGVMNYPARRAILDTFFPEAMAKPTNVSVGEPLAVVKAEFHADASHDPGTHHPRAKALCEKLEEAFPVKRFGTPMNLLGSHDNVRLATIAADHPDRLSQAWALLLFLPGAPCIYAGDELCQEGGKDPDNRRCFPWDELGLLAKNPLYPLLQELIAFRQSQKAIRHGNFGCRPEGHGIVVWRELGKDRFELRLGFPGQVGIQPSREVEWDERLSYKTHALPGMAGRMVESGGWQIARIRRLHS